MRTEEYKAKDRELKKNIRLERKSKGLCPRCGGERDDLNKAYCFACREYMADRRAKYLMLGICPICGKERIYGDEKMCICCTDKTRMRTKDRRKTTDDESREIKRIYNRNLIENRKKQGLCPRCGKRKMTAGFQTCTFCRYKSTERARERRART